MTKPERMTLQLCTKMYVRQSKTEFGLSHQLHINETLYHIEIIKSSAQTS